MHTTQTYRYRYNHNIFNCHLFKTIQYIKVLLRLTAFLQIDSSGSLNRLALVVHTDQYRNPPKHPLIPPLAVKSSNRIFFFHLTILRVSNFPFLYTLPISKIFTVTTSNNRTLVPSRFPPPFKERFPL